MLDKTTSSCFEEEGYLERKLEEGYFNARGGGGGYRVQHGDQ